MIGSYGYDLVGNRTSLSRPHLAGDTGVPVTGHSYDHENRLYQTSYPDTGSGSAQETTTYNPDGLVYQFVDANTYTTTYAYDSLDRLQQVTDALGNLATSSYDAVGNLFGRSDFHAVGGAVHTTTYGYDQLDRGTTATNALGKATGYGYDANGDLTTVLDANAHRTSFQYDPLGERTLVILPSLKSRGTAYDADGNVHVQTDEQGHTLTYVYDALNHPKMVTDQQGRPTQYLYDPAGNRTILTDALNRTTTYSYYADNQPQAIVYSDGVTPGVTYTYDPATGLRKTMVDGIGTTTYGYDARDRLSSVQNGALQSVGYGYDGASNLTAITYPDSKVVGRGYDALERLHTVTDWLAHTTTFDYDPAGNPAKETLPNGVTASPSYNAADQLTGIVDARPVGGVPTTFWAYSYTPDAIGQVKVATDPVQASLKHTYTRTSLDQISQDKATSGATTVSTGGWTYNPAYSLGATTTSAGGTSASSTLTVDTVDQLKALVTTSGGATTRNLSLTYNADGDRTGQTNSVGGAAVTYGYDQADRLTAYAATSPVVSASYRYDGDGLRQSKTVGGAATGYAYDQAQGLPLLLQEGSTRYLTGPGGLPIEQVDGAGNVLYYLQDQLGSTRGLADPTGAVAASYSYDPYGARTVVSGTAVTSLGYAGQYTDAESGLQYLRARYYDPATAQFLTVDPLLARTGHRYAYAEDNPLTSTDPSGECPICVAPLIPFILTAVDAGLAYLDITLAQHAIEHRPITFQEGASSFANGAVTTAGLELGGPAGGLVTQGMARLAVKAGTVFVAGVLGQLASNDISPSTAQNPLLSGVGALAGEGVGSAVGAGFRAIVGGGARSATRAADAAASDAAATSAASQAAETTGTAESHIILSLERHPKNETFFEDFTAFIRQEHPDARAYREVPEGSLPPGFGGSERAIDDAIQQADRIHFNLTGMNLATVTFNKARVAPLTRADKAVTDWELFQVFGHRRVGDTTFYRTSNPSSGIWHEVPPPTFPKEWQEWLRKQP